MGFQLEPTRFYELGLNVSFINELKLQTNRQKTKHSKNLNAKRPCLKHPKACVQKLPWGVMITQEASWEF
jgi:hypothetical protein